MNASTTAWTVKPAQEGCAVQVYQVSKTFAVGKDTRQALKAINLTVRPGERVALLGASGSGKSTLLRCVAGLESIDDGAGRIEVEGAVVQAHGLLARDIRAVRRRVGVVFQQFNLVGRLSVLGNVLTGLSAQRPWWRSLIGWASEAERIQALQALAAVGLAEQAFQRASTLSGGQQQRVAMARVLVQGCHVLLADEPVASLDPESTRRVMSLLTSLNREHGMTLLVSLHHVGLAKRYCDRVVALREGALVFDGPVQALTPALLQELYGCAAAELDDAPTQDASHWTAAWPRASAELALAS